MSVFNYTEARFVCDDNLGKLARYLRVGGFDTVFDSHISDSDLITISLDENRHILTRDHQLIERTIVRDYLLIESDRWIDQLKAVMGHFDLKFARDRMFLRCLEDNTLTETALKQDIKSIVYTYTYEHHTEFRQCPKCKRVFWAGSHTAAILRKLTDGGIDIVD